MDRACSTYRGEQRCMQGLVVKPEGKRQLGKPRHRLEDAIEMDFHDVEFGAWLL
jgi:hypothetical protein